MTMIVSVHSRIRRPSRLRKVANLNSLPRRYRPYVLCYPLCPFHPYSVMHTDIIPYGGRVCQGFWGNFGQIWGEFRGNFGFFGVTSITGV